jgi:hypothetical protein
MSDPAQFLSQQHRLDSLRIEIDRGIEALDRGDYITIETEDQLAQFFEDIARRSDARLKESDQ